MVIACSALSQFIYETFHRRALNRWCNHTGISGPIGLKGEQASAERGSICLGSSSCPFCPATLAKLSNPKARAFLHRHIQGRVSPGTCVPAVASGPARAAGKKLVQDHWVDLKRVFE